ncbi:MAG: hypothetical protein E7653_02970 [Ruminococcaceae bacterium]|nr:hypothetical protein [Oscillospiraceae bacterium]
MDMIDILEKNVWQSAVNKELIEAMRLCGCEKKYIDGSASDYECFCELLSVAKKMHGHDALNAFLHKLDRRGDLGVSYKELTLENARAIWLGENKKIFSCDNKHCENSVEKYNFYKSVLLLDRIEKNTEDYRCFIENLKHGLMENQSGVLMRFSENTFAVPNPYLAECIFGACQKIQNDILLCQILCEIILDKECRKKQIYIDTYGNYKYVHDLISFLNKHNMGASISIAVRVDDAVDDVLSACQLSNDKCFINPYIEVTKNISKEKLCDFKKHLSSIYPIGMLTVIE